MNKKDIKKFLTKPCIRIIIELPTTVKYAWNEKTERWEPVNPDK